MISRLPRCPAALTLIEVLVSLVLVAAVITTIVRAHAHSIEQLHATQRLDTATTLARNLLAEWHVHRPDSIPSTGLFEDIPGWTWRRTVHLTDIVDNAHVRRVDLDIVHTRPGHSPEIMTTLSWVEKVPHDADRNN